MKKPNHDRWLLIRDMLIFQVKLGMDALRDLLLSPVAFICVLIDLFKGNDKSQSTFHKLMALGHQSDIWLNLFGTHEAKQDSELEATEQKHTSPQDNKQRQSKVSVDVLFSQVEFMLKEQHDKGGLTASAKDTIDRYLDKLVKKADVQKITEIESLDEKPQEVDNKLK